MRDLLTAVVVVSALGGLGWWTAPSVRPPPPPGVEAPTVREIALTSLDNLMLREEAIRILGFVGLEEDLPLLRQLVADPRWTTPATHALIDLLGPDAISYLEPLLANRWFAGRRAVILALGHANDPRSAELLVELYTTSTESWVVYAAASSLEKRQEARAIEPFANTFRRTGEEARRLASFPVDSPARVILREAVKTGRQPHAGRAMNALATAGDPEVVPLLIETLKARAIERRVTALRALGELHDPRTLSAILSFEANIDSNDEHLAWMGALWATEDPQAHARALAVLSTAPAGLARAAADQVPHSVLRAMPVEFIELAQRRPGAVGDTIAVELMNVEWHEVPPPILEMARARLPTHSGWSDQDSPTRLLCRFGTPQDLERVASTLNRAAESGDTRVLQIFEAIPTDQRTEEHVEAVILLLSHTSDLAVVDRTFRALESHLDETRRAEIALALLDRIAVDSVMRKAMALPEGEAHVAELARSGTQTERVAAKIAAGEGNVQGARRAMLSRHFGSSAVEPLTTFDDQVRALQTPSEGNTWQAAQALAESSDPRALDKLQEAVMAGGASAGDASTALQMHHPERTEMLVDLLFSDPDPDRRILALDMGYISNPNLAFEAMSDESAAVRQQAIDYLAANGSSLSAASIREVLDDEDPDVQEAAARALKQLGGRHAREAAERIDELMP